MHRVSALQICRLGATGEAAERDAQLARWHADDTNGRVDDREALAATDENGFAADAVVLERDIWEPTI